MHILIMLNTLLPISLVAVTGSLAATDLAAAQDNMLTNDDTIQQLINEQISTGSFSSTADLSTEAPEPSLTIIRELRNATKEVGEGMRLRCEIKGSPPAKWIKWFM